MLQFTDKQLTAYIDILEEAEKSFTGNIKKDVIQQAQTDIFFNLGIRDKDLMKFGSHLAASTGGAYHSHMLDIISRFEGGKYTFDQAFKQWRTIHKKAMMDMYRAGGASVGNPFFKDLKIPRRDLQMMSRYMRQEGKYFKKFLWDIKDPKHVPLNKMLGPDGKRLPGYRLQRWDYKTRSGLYPESLKAMRWNGAVVGAGSNMEIRWVLGMPEKHCNDCPRLSRRIWTPQTLPFVPKSGNTECVWQCSCSLEFRQKTSKRTFDLAGKGTEGAMRALGRNARVYDSAGNEIGGELQRGVEDYVACMNKARQMISITTGEDKKYWIGLRKRLNRNIIDMTQAGGYRVVPTTSVASLTGTVKAMTAKGGTLVDDFITLVAGDEAHLVRGDYSSFGVIAARGDGRQIFKSPTGMTLNPNVDTDIVFTLKKSKDAFNNIIKEVEDDIMKLYHKDGLEHCALLNSNGDVIFKKSGSKGKIIYTSSEANKFNNQELLIHNHPTGSPFSRVDLEWFSFKNIKQARIVSDDYIYTLKPKGNKWPSWETLGVEHRTQETGLFSKYNDIYFKRASTMTEEMAQRLTKQEHFHEVMKIIAKIFDLDYDRVSVK